MNDTLKLKGHVSYKQFGADGKLKDAWEVDNIVVTAGKTYLAAWIAAASQAGKFMEYVGVGSSSTAATLGDTALGTELARVAGTITSSVNVWQNQATFSAGVGTGTWQEAGLLSASSSGTLFARQVFSARVKEATDTIQVTWQVTIS